MWSLSSCFHPQKVNVGRQSEFDIAKGLAIFCMAWVHTLEETESLTDDLMPMLIEKVFGGPFAGPVFMVAMGIGMAYSTHTTPKQLMRRGVTLLVIGFLLNIFRFSLPSVVGAVGQSEAIDWQDILIWQISVDILQFAGLAFLYFGLVKQWQWRTPTLIMVALGLSVLGTYLHGTTVDDMIGRQFLSYLWSASEEGFFPFFNWLIFVTFGLVFGQAWQHCADKATFYRYMTPIGMTLGLGYILSMFYLDLGMYRDVANAHYYMNTIDATFVCLFVVGWFGVCDGLSRIMPNTLLSWLSGLSQNINQVYCIHWIILGWAGVWFRDFLQKTQLPVWEVTLYAVIVVIASGILAQQYRRCRQALF